MLSPRSGSQWSFRGDQYIKQSDRIYVFADREVINTTSSNAYNAPQCPFLHN